MRCQRTTANALARDELEPHRAWLAERLASFEPQMGFLQAMRRALPDDGIFVDEVTQLGFAARLAFPVYHPRTYSLGRPSGQSRLGARRRAWREGGAAGQAVLAIAGDGGIMYQIGDLATAVQHNIAVVVVLFDNGMFGNVRRIQDEYYGGRTIASDLKNPDFANLARVRRIGRVGQHRGWNGMFRVSRECARPSSMFRAAYAEPVGHDPDAACAGSLATCDPARFSAAASHKNGAANNQ